MNRPTAQLVRLNLEELQARINPATVYFNSTTGVISYVAATGEANDILLTSRGSDVSL